MEKAIQLAVFSKLFEAKVEFKSTTGRLVSADLTYHMILYDQILPPCGPRTGGFKWKMKKEATQLKMRMKAVQHLEGKLIQIWWQRKERKMVSQKSGFPPAPAPPASAPAPASCILLDGSV